MSGVQKLSAEQRAEAVAMYAKCKNFRVVAVAFNVSHERVRTWVRDAMATSSPAKARSAERGPIFVNGVRLGRLALWT